MKVKILPNKYGDRLSRVLNMMPLLRENAKLDFPNEPEAADFAKACDEVRDSINKVFAAAENMRRRLDLEAMQRRRRNSS